MILWHPNVIGEKTEQQFHCLDSWRLSVQVPLDSNVTCMCAITEVSGSILYSIECGCITKDHSSFFPLYFQIQWNFKSGLPAFWHLEYGGCPRLIPSLPSSQSVAVPLSTALLPRPWSLRLYTTLCCPCAHYRECRKDPSPLPWSSISNPPHSAAALYLSQTKFFRGMLMILQLLVEYLQCEHPKPEMSWRSETYWALA